MPSSSLFSQFTTDPKLFGINFIHRKSRKTRRFHLSSTGIESSLHTRHSLSTSPEISEIIVRVLTNLFLTFNSRICTLPHSLSIRTNLSWHRSTILNLQFSANDSPRHQSLHKHSCVDQDVFSLYAQWAMGTICSHVFTQQLVKLLSY